MSLKSLTSGSKVVLSALAIAAFALSLYIGGQREVAAAATCGNTICESGETCLSCASDCGACPSCGDATCDSNEDCGSCAADCGSCASCDSDGVCNSGEDCAGCPADCGACGACDQDLSCDSGESCANCPADCGECSPGCGDSICDLSESCSNCSADCGACPSKTDFATCPAVLPACTSPGQDCCHRSFASGSVLIPMDRCHQPIVGTVGRYDSPQGSKDHCAAPATPGSDDLGVYEAYGLVYRLQQNDFRVYWLVNPTKDPSSIATSEPPVTQNYTDRDIDFWLLSNGAAPLQYSAMTTTLCTGSCAPVLRIDPSTMAALPGSYDQLELPVRGSAFIIDSADRPRFNEFMRKTGEFAFLAGVTGASHYYDFSDVELYEIQPNTEFRYLDFRDPGPVYPAFNGGDSAPVAMSLDPGSPRLAINSDYGWATAWLAKAKLNEPANYPDCLSGDFSPTTAVYCDVTAADVQSGYLHHGRFDWAWLDSWTDGSNCTTPGSSALMQQLHSFLTAVPGFKNGNPTLFVDAAVASAEQCRGLQPLGVQSTTGPGLVTAANAPAGELIVRYANNLLAQFGDIPVQFAAGVAGTFSRFGGLASGYQPLTSLMRLVSEDVTAAGNTACDYHRSGSNCDVQAAGPTAETTDAFAYGLLGDAASNGAAVYLGGNQYATTTHAAQIRGLFNAVLALPRSVGLVSPQSSAPIEVSRSGSTLARVDGFEAVYQGSFAAFATPRAVTQYNGSADDATFTFPHFTGHLRAVDVAAFFTTTLDFSTVSAPYLLFDAASGIPPVTATGCATYFTSGCRTVFTNTREGHNAGTRPARVALNTNELVAGTGADLDSDGLTDLHEILGTDLTVAEAQTLVSRLLAGHYNSGTSLWEPRLGAVDRSTPAVIEASPLAGGPRPTMVYFGGLDGMLHAVCAEVLGYCTAKGQELWAYIPRTQLPLTRQNRQRIDGSPTVTDVFGDFDYNPGTPPSFHTVLTFTTGSGDPGFVGSDPAVIALDITDPSDPKILWELTTSAKTARPDGEEIRDGYDLGHGVHLAMGTVDISGTQRHLTFAHTNNGGTAPQAADVIKAIDTVTGLVVWKRSGIGTDLESGLRVPASAIPGGVTIVDTDANDLIDTVLIPSLRGRIVKVDAATGVSAYGGVPLFSFNGWPVTTGPDSDFHPFGASLTVFRERGTGTLMVLGVTGGYADPIGLHDWISPATATQYAIAVPVDSPTANATPSFVIDLGVGNRAFSQAVVAGNEIFVATDTFDANSVNYGLTGPTGSLLRYDLTDAATLGTNTVADAKSTAALSGAAGGVDVRGGVVYSGSGSVATRADFSADHDAVGASVESQAANDARRLIWLRLR